MIALDNIARFIGLLIALFGTSVFIRRRAGIAYAFGMSITCSFIVSILFLFSLFMKITAIIWILAGTGVVFFVIELIRREIHKEDIFNWTNLFLLIGTIILFIYLSGKRFVFIDDFTHWAVMARSVFEHQGLPTAADPLISFTSYPPGTALWTCFVVTVTGGRTEDVYLIAQAFLILVFFSPLTCFDGLRSEKKERGQGIPTLIGIALLILIMALCAVIMTFGAKILSLCVDGLLSAAGFGGVAFLILSHASAVKKALLSIPIMITLTLIKTHGILYAVAMIAVLIYYAARERKDERTLAQGTAGHGSGDSPGRSSRRGGRALAIIGGAVAVAAAELLWNWHVKVSFPDNGESMHALSISRWIAIFEARGAERSSAILRGFFHNLTAWYLLLFLLGIVGIYLIIYLFGRRTGQKTARNAGWVFLLSIGHFVVYLGGMLFVYLFSMEDGGADRLEAFGRYLGVEFTYLGGILLCFLVKVVCEYYGMFALDGKVSPLAGNAVPSAGKASPSSSAARRQDFAKKHGNAIRLIPLILVDVVAVAFILVFWVGGLTHFRRYNQSSRERVNVLMRDSDYSGDILIYAPSRMDGWYEQTLMECYGNYDFRTKALDMATTYRGDIEEKMSRHSHLLIYEVDEELVDFLRACGWTCEIKPGLYNILEKERE